MEDNQDESGVQLVNVLTPGEVIEITGIPSHTLRRWAAAHAALLSPGANPGKYGKSRRFTLQDVERLKAAKTFHEKGVSVEIINARLGSILVGDIAQPDDNKRADDVQTEAIQTTQESPSTAQGAIMVYQAVDLLTQRIEAVERRQRDVLIAFGAGVIVAGIFFLIIVLLTRPG